MGNYQLTLLIIQLSVNINIFKKKTGNCENKRSTGCTSQRFTQARGFSSSMMYCPHTLSYNFSSGEQLRPQKCDKMHEIEVFADEQRCPKNCIFFANCNLWCSCDKVYIVRAKIRLQSNQTEEALADITQVYC